MKNTVFSLILFLVLSVFTSEAFSIPAFARKYNMTCKTCHSPFPKLKPYGEDFAANGFTLKDKDAPRYFVPTGDDRLSLIRDLPLAFRLEAYTTYNQDDTKRLDFTGPIVFKLLSGGAITENISYYVYYILEKGEPGKIEDAFLYFNDLFGSDLDFSIGQFQVSDPLFKRELRLTQEDYMIYKSRPGFSSVDLTYDRGIMLSLGLPTGTDLVLEVINGSGIGETFAGGTFDKDKYKNFFGRISHEFVEQLRLGTFGYYGKEMVEDPVSKAQAPNELWMLGGDATISLDPFELNVQYISRKDKNPYALASAMEVKTQGGFAELILRPDGDNSKWYGVATYNYIDSDDNSQDLKSGALHLGYLLRRNIRIVGELNYNFDIKYARLALGIITAF